MELSVSRKIPSTFNSPCMQLEMFGSITSTYYTQDWKLLLQHCVNSFGAIIGGWGVRKMSHLVYLTSAFS